MAHIKENDLMLAFYHASPLLQKQILNEYQCQSGDNTKRDILVTFLEKRFRQELTIRRNSTTNNSPHFTV
jgi:hypothetical protein